MHKDLNFHSIFWLLQATRTHKKIYDFYEKIILHFLFAQSDGKKCTHLLGYALFSTSKDTQSLWLNFEFLMKWMESREDHEDIDTKIKIASYRELVKYSLNEILYI